MFFSSFASQLTMKPGTSKQVRNKKKKNKKKKENHKPEAESETRDWLDLPKDVMILIFLKLGVIELLYTAQSVCSAWRKLAKEPQLYRCIDMWDPWNYFDECNFDPSTKMALEAIDRSCGQLVEFSISYFGTDEVLQRIVVDNSSSLRRLRLASCYQVSEDAFIEALKKFSLLEELELCLCSFTAEVIQVVGRSCPQLNYFRLNRRGVMYSPSVVLEDFNDEALAIAANMPQLRRLHLFGNMLTDIGLQAILDKCLHLEYLDLRQCFGININEELRNKCREIKTLRLPNDSTDDYEFDATIHYSGIFESDEEYDDYMYGLSDLDLYDEDEVYDMFNDDDDGGSTSDYFPF